MNGTDERNATCRAEAPTTLRTTLKTTLMTGCSDLTDVPNPVTHDKGTLLSGDIGDTAKIP